MTRRHSRAAVAVLLAALLTGCAQAISGTPTWPGARLDKVVLTAADFPPGVQYDRVTRPPGQPDGAGGPPAMLSDPEGCSDGLTRAIAESAERGPGSAAEYLVAYDGARIVMTVLTWPLDLDRLAATAERCAKFQTFFDSSMPGIPMTTLRLKTPRRGCSGTRTAGIARHRIHVPSEYSRTAGSLHMLAASLGGMDAECGSLVESVAQEFQSLTAPVSEILRLARLAAESIEAGAVSSIPAKVENLIRGVEAFVRDRLDSSSAVLEVVGNDYVRSARAKGLPNRTVVTRYILRAALPSVITVLGLVFANVLTGAVLVEKIFSWPGIGQYAYEAAVNLDVPAIAGVNMFVAVVYVTVNFVVDILYAVIDPRIRLT